MLMLKNQGYDAKVFVVTFRWKDMYCTVCKSESKYNIHTYIHTHAYTQRETQAKHENGLLCWQQLFPNPRPWAILCSQAGYYMATIRGAGAQHLVVSYSGPSVAADCTVSQPGGPPSMTLASHSRVNQEPVIIQWACIETHSEWKLL